MHHDYLRIFKVSVLQAMGISTVGMHEIVKTRSEHFSLSIAGSIPVGRFLLNLFCFNTILTELPELSI